MLSMSSDIMAPLGAYKEVGKGLTDSPTSSVVKEATVGWLAAAQVSYSWTRYWVSMVHVYWLS